MTDDLTARIAAIIAEHTICMCGEWAENFEENAIHISQQIIKELGLTQERADFVQTNQWPPIPTGMDAMTTPPRVPHVRSVTHWERDHDD